MKIAIEPFSEALFVEVEPLLKAHWEEVALFRDVVSLEVDVEFYLRLESKGNLVCFTVREEGILVGYAVFFTGYHPHYKSLFTVRNDVIYMDPKHRGKTSVRLIRECEKHFKGSVPPKARMIMTWHAKLSNEFQGLLEHLGYSVMESSLGKLL